MCKRNSPNTNEASTGRVRENPLIKKKKVSMGCVRETPQIQNEASMGRVSENPLIKKKKKKTAWDV